MNSSVKPGELIAMIAGLVVFIASFLSWYSQDFSEFGEDVEITGSAWAGWLFPVAAIPALFGLVIAVLVAVGAFSNATLPEKLAGFSLPQLYLALSAFSALLMIGYLIVSPGDLFLETLPEGASGVSFSLGKGVGFWLSLLGVAGLVAGSVMIWRDDDGVRPASGAAPQSF